MSQRCSKKRWTSVAAGQHSFCSSRQQFHALRMGLCFRLDPMGSILGVAQISFVTNGGGECKLAS